MMKFNFARKTVASLASAALVASMVVVAPTAAFATVGEGSTIEATQSSIAITAGDQQTISSLFDTNILPGGDGEYHVDYQITATSGSDASGITVVKHSGLVTVPAGTSSDAWVTVTAMLVPIATTQIQQNPCASYMDSDSLTVYVNEPTGTGYGAQGISGNTIEMVNPVVSSFTGNNTDGYTNNLTAVRATNSTLSFTYIQSAGINNTTVTKYIELNGSKITVTNSNGDTVATLAETGNLTIPTDGIDASAGTVTLNLNTVGLTTGQIYTLNFASTVCGNNTSKMLGIPLAFTFRYIG